MQILPGIDDLSRDQRWVAGLLIGTLSRELEALPAGAPELACLLQEEFERADMMGGLYPGLWALAYRRQGKPRDAASDPRAEVHRLLWEARHAAERARSGGCETWRVDLAPPERHLQESLERAVMQLPRRPGQDEASTAMTLTPWSEAHRQVFSQTSQLLAALWPEMLVELRHVIHQVALMEGGGIDGFTDFATHGAVFVNTRRLTSTRVPPHIRLAEALIHEGCHTRCNAAAVVRPFLKGSHKSAPVVMTPLRPDPRPLTGLFQQLVVLCRCLAFYERVVARGLGGEVTAARCEKLRAQARQALGTLQAHARELTDPGLDVVRDAGMLLERPLAAQEASV